MRIISGTARGRKLAEFKGKDVRPTPDRVREALFSLLFSKLGSFTDLKVLDLFSGSGALALEALSRHAKSAILVDLGKESIKLAEENIKRCKFEDRTRVIRQDARQALPSLAASAPFDLIFMDPPYNKSLIQPVLIEIDRLNLLNEDGIICAESESGETVDDCGRLECFESRRYGSTTVHLLRLRNNFEE